LEKSGKQFWNKIRNNAIPDPGSTKTRSHRIMINLAINKILPHLQNYSVSNNERGNWVLKETGTRKQVYN
jgi:hypothetical protein